MLNTASHPDQPMNQRTTPSATIAHDCYSSKYKYKYKPVPSKQNPSSSPNQAKMSTETCNSPNHGATNPSSAARAMYASKPASKPPASWSNNVMHTKHNSLTWWSRPCSVLGRSLNGIHDMPLWQNSSWSRNGLFSFKYPGWMIRVWFVWIVGVGFNFWVRRVGSNDETPDWVVEVSTLIRKVFKSKWFGRFLFCFLWCLVCRSRPWYLCLCAYTFLYTNICICILNRIRIIISQGLLLAINGFGRIGRLVFWYASDNPTLEIVHINDLCAVDSATYLAGQCTDGRYDFGK